MRIFSGLTILFGILLFAGCTNNEQFRVNGEIEGKPTMNIRVSYYADGAQRSIVTAAREGEFEIYGSSKQPTMVEITDYEYRPLVRLWAANGETFEVKIDRTKPYDVRVDGNEVSTRWAKFLNDNAESFSAGRDSTNAAIARYIDANRSDIVSTLLLITAYDSSADPFMADSLMALLTAEARPTGLTDGYNFLLQRLVTESVTDTIAPFYYEHRDSAHLVDLGKSRSNILAFTEENASNYVPLADRLEKAARKKGIKVYDLRIDPSRGGYVPDSIKRTVGRIPGGIAGRGVDRLGLPFIPYFIVTDSAGVQFYRGPASERAIQVADSLSKLK